MEQKGIYTPCVITQVEYINTGARVGKIDDILLELILNEGSLHKFRPILIAENIDFMQDSKNDSQKVIQFTNVSIRPGSTMQQSIIFQPTDHFDIDYPTKIKLKLLYYSVDNLSRQRDQDGAPKIVWKASNLCYHFDVSKEDLLSWHDKQTVILEAEEVTTSRQNYFLNRK
jgi:hypothetical protein